MQRRVYARAWMMWHMVAPARRGRYSREFGANMAYSVEFSARAARDLEMLYLEKNAAESPAAARWYNGLEQAVYALETHPHRWSARPGRAAAMKGST
jgi:hypothetical protein